MIPLRDTTPTRNYPVANTAIIGINVVVYCIQFLQGAEINQFIYIYGLVPARYSLPQIAQYFTTGQQVFSLVSFMFLHGGFWHILGNMWSLYIFGDNVEDRLGSIRYALFYLLCGIASGLSHLILNLNSNCLFHSAPQIKDSHAHSDICYSLVYQYSGIRFSRLMVLTAVYQCRQQPWSRERHCLVGPYRRIYIRHVVFKAVQHPAG
jgi:hypothetical protein